MLVKGSVVRSLAGRDKDGLLAVCEVADKYVTVCDGKERPLENPKRKNLRHVADTGLRIPPEAADSNRALRKALAGFAERV
ncbi:MAG: KOW domain-containing RNA-binding protein [Acutalibacteraceae bacterium]